MTICPASSSLSVGASVKRMPWSWAITTFLDEEEVRQVRQVIDEVIQRYPPIKSERWPALAAFS